MRKLIGGLICLVVLASLGSLVHGGGNPPVTVITVEKLHCGGCAKRVEAKLKEIPGVASVKSDVKTKTLWVNPHPGKTPSPRGLWEAVEKANDRPTKLQGPSGTFTKKPQS